MDITANNFHETLPLALSSVRTADFIAFDTEFSGLSVAYEDQGHDFDSAEAKYQKLKFNCERMFAFQFGITTYKWDSNLNKYVMRPFNFYTFPNSTILEKQGNLMFDASAVKFLISNNFDFTKLFREGISYARLSEKDLVKSRIDKKINGVHLGRFYQHMGSRSQKDLDFYMSKVHSFVEQTNKRDPENKKPTLELKIESHPLKKELAAQIKDAYGKERTLYTQFEKGSDLFIIKRNYNQENKAADIISSKFAKETKEDALYEDEVCVARMAESPLYEEHAIILPKVSIKGLKNLAEATEEQNQVIEKMNKAAMAVMKILKLESKGFTIKS
jgi:hypothetical protein